MADQQPNTPSAEPSEGAPAQASAPPSEPAAQQASDVPSWWQRITRRQPQQQEPAPPDQEAAAGTASPPSLVLTQEEFDRRVQAETDRREAKRMAEAERAARRKLRDDDPFAFAEQDRKAEEAQTSQHNIQALFGSIGVEHDKVSIDPILHTLSETERKRILGLEGAGLGLDGRKLIVTEAMKSLEKHWRAEGAKDAEARLRKNPAFRKQILAESRGQQVEPELLPGTGDGAAADHSVSALLRSHYRLG